MKRRDLLKTAAASLILAGVEPAAAAAEKSRLILLGTAGGPTPKANRAACANAIMVGSSVYVVDAGNGVARQMALAGIQPSQMQGLFLTHQHSDHVADAGNLLLLGWSADLVHPVPVYGPPPIKRMYDLFREMNATDIAIREIDEGRVPFAGIPNPREITKGGVIHKDAKVTVTAALVDHPPVVPSFGYRFDCPDRSIVFSGDTAPSKSLIALAGDADVLVHEALYLPAMESLLAREPNATRLKEHLLASHTTAQDAGRVAAEAGVKTLVLSHLVPGGYPYVEDAFWADAAARHFKGEIIVGKDLMEI